MSTPFDRACWAGLLVRLAVSAGAEAALRCWAANRLTLSIFAALRCWFGSRSAQARKPRCAAGLLGWLAVHLAPDGRTASLRLGCWGG